MNEIEIQGEQAKEFINKYFIWVALILIFSAIGILFFA